MRDEPHLSRATKARHPILTPGGLAYWNRDSTLIKAIVLGAGHYHAATDTHEGVTIQVNAARTVLPGHAVIKRGEIHVVPATAVMPREAVTPHREHGYTLTHATWAFDLTCPVHAEIHTKPTTVCRFTRTDIALIDEITDATARGRIISHAAAREIASWYVSPRQIDNTSAASCFVRMGQLPSGDTDTVWSLLGGTNLSLEKAQWRRDGLQALHEYVRWTDRPRGPRSIHKHTRSWPHLELWELDRDRRYKITTEQYTEPGTTPQTRWIVRFCGDPIGTAPGPQTARRLAVRHHSNLVHGTIPQPWPTTPSTTAGVAHAVTDADIIDPGGSATPTERKASDLHETTPQATAPHR